MESKFKVGDIVSEEGSDLKYVIEADMGSRYRLKCVKTQWDDVALVLFAIKETVMEKYRKVG